MTLLSIQGADALAALGDAGCDSRLPPLDPVALADGRADAHRVVVDRRGLPVARCALWWRDPPRHGGHRLGLIGHYAAADDRAAGRLLADACGALRANGCTLAVGPIDGSTWRRYRFVTQRGAEPPFAMEPDHPDAWALQFRRAGFRTLATYTSSLCDRLAGEEDDPRLARARDRFARDGIRVRSMAPGRFEEEMRSIHRVATASFRNNFLYRPISEADFLALYRPLAARVRPELIFLAERGPEPVGFLFMLPDFNCAARGVPVDTAILKTVAVLPGAAQAGLGSWLVGHSHGRARALGYRRVIHALMHDANPSMRVSRKYGAPMRRYALFANNLQPGDEPR